MSYRLTRIFGSGTESFPYIWECFPISHGILHFAFGALILDFHLFAFLDCFISGLSDQIRCYVGQEVEGRICAGLCWSRSPAELGTQSLVECEAISGGIWGAPCYLLRVRKIWAQEYGGRWSCRWWGLCGNRCGSLSRGKLWLPQHCENECLHAAYGPLCFILRRNRFWWAVKHSLDWKSW